MALVPTSPRADTDASIDDSGPTVTVVIPAYNAAATLSETLSSVLAQTYRALEIFVVVDGATDETEAIARRYAAIDSRVNVVVTPNNGLPTARNIGARAGTGEFIAPIDADDVWHPDKIRRQIQVFAQHGERVGFVYSYYRRIDQWNTTIVDGASLNWHGDIFLPSLFFNAVGNGSALLIRRAAFEQVGGYDPSMRGVGCEDFLLQILISRKWSVQLVPQFLTGYRFMPKSMSRQHVSIARGQLRMLDIVERRCPEIDQKYMTLARAKAMLDLSFAYFRMGILRNSVKSLFRGFRLSPFMASQVLLGRLANALRLFRRNLVIRTGRKGVGPLFQDLDPGEDYIFQGPGPPASRFLERLRREARRCAEFGPKTRHSEKAQDQPGTPRAP